VSYDGPSLNEWLAEYRSRRPPTEVTLHQTDSREPVTSPVSRQPGITSLRIIRLDDPDDPVPGHGVYLLSENEAGESLSDTWHEDVQEAFAQAEFEFGIARERWVRADEAEQ